MSEITDDFLNDVYIISMPQDAAELFRSYMESHALDPDKEHFLVALLNTKNGVIGVRNISMGTLNASLVHPREVFKEAVVASAASMIACHNHPSDLLEVSEQDKSMTKRLVQTGKIMDIPVLDHIVLGRYGDRHISFREKEFIK